MTLFCKFTVKHEFYLLANERSFKKNSLRLLKTLPDRNFLQRNIYYSTISFANKSKKKVNLKQTYLNKALKHKRSK